MRRKGSKRRRDRERRLAVPVNEESEEFLDRLILDGEITTAFPTLAELAQVASDLAGERMAQCSCLPEVSVTVLVVGGERWPKIELFHRQAICPLEGEGE